MLPYPFSAVVGHDDLALALLVNAVSPAVGGVLVRGEKGTAKSTVVRALAGLLPPVAVVDGCRFSCDPAAPDPSCPDGPHPPGAGSLHRPTRLVELPVGAAEDRLVGALDLERALTDGVRAYEPGLLAAAHRGLLYVDEVNLLHDHLVDLLLDAAALGTSYVEREGVSVRHAARFLLVGTMNPEEGELRPQLLDRFGLTVEVRASREPSVRAEVVRRRLAYEADPDAFGAAWAAADQDLGERITAARDLLPKVVLPDTALRQVTAACAAFDVDGMRADLVTARAAIALAAWNGRDEVVAEDVRQAALLALPHRRRRGPFDAPGMDTEQLDDALNSVEQRSAEHEPPDPPGGGAPSPAEDPDSGGPDAGTPAASGDTSTPDTSAGPGVDAPAHARAGDDPDRAADGDRSDGPAAAEQPAVAAGTPAGRPKLLAVPGVGEGGAAGRRSRAATGTGRTVGARRPTGTLTRLHLAATLSAAAPYQRARGRSGTRVLLRAADLREPVREGRESNLVLFCVDASGSMAARRRMTAVKGAVLSLLLDAYQRRDTVGLVTFRAGEAAVALAPTGSVDVAAARLDALPTGGRTPLAAGLTSAAEVLRREHRRDPLRRPLLVVVTDGRVTEGPEPAAVAAMIARDGVASVVVDCESGHVRLGLAGRLAATLGGELVRLEELSADALAGVARSGRVA